MSNALGYEGVCRKCGVEQRIYWIYADAEHRRKMEDKTIYQEASNCPSCVTSKIFQVARTMKWLRQLPPKVVLRDLKKGGINIDFKEALRQEKENARNDVWLADNEKRVKERIDWKRRTQGGVHKAFR
jgi:hypothetical protein